MKIILNILAYSVIVGTLITGSEIQAVGKRKKTSFAMRQKSKRLRRGRIELNAAGFKMSCAINQNSLNKLKALLDHNRNPSSYVLQNSYTPVGSAIKKYLERKDITSPDVIRMLLEAGFDPNLYRYKYHDKGTKAGEEKGLTTVGALVAFFLGKLERREIGEKEYRLFELVYEYGNKDKFCSDDALILYGALLTYPYSHTGFADTEFHKACFKIALLGGNLLDLQSGYIHKQILSLLPEGWRVLAYSNLTDHKDMLANLHEEIIEELRGRQKRYRKKVGVGKLFQNAQIHGRLPLTCRDYTYIPYGSIVYPLSVQPHRYSPLESHVQ
jgi:hypothetical protein